MIFTFIRAGLVVLIGLALLKTCGLSLHDITNTTPTQLANTVHPVDVVTQIKTIATSPDPNATMLGMVQHFYVAFKTNLVLVWESAKASF